MVGQKKQDWSRGKNNKDFYTLEQIYKWVPKQDYNLLIQSVLDHNFKTLQPYIIKRLNLYLCKGRIGGINRTTITVTAV